MTAKTNTEIEEVLSGWVRQALSSNGRLADETDPATWVAQRFLEWFRPQVEEALEAVEGTAADIREELQLLRDGTARKFDGVLHEMAHLDDNLAVLRRCLGFVGTTEDDSVASQ